jgi:hypothetical protein
MRLVNILMIALWQRRCLPAHCLDAGCGFLTYRRLVALRWLPFSASKYSPPASAICVAIVACVPAASIVTIAPWSAKMASNSGIAPGSSL